MSSRFKAVDYIKYISFYKWLPEGTEKCVDCSICTVFRGAAAGVAGIPNKIPATFVQWDKIQEQSAQSAESVLVWVKHRKNPELLGSDNIPKNKWGSVFSLLNPILIQSAWMSWEQ